MIELFLIEQLAAGGAIDLGAQLGDAVFIGVLHLGLTRDQPRQDVIAEREIGCRGGRPHAEHDDCAELARRTGRSVKSVWAAALAAAGER